MHTELAQHALVSPQLSELLKRVTLCSRTLGVDVTIRQSLMNTGPLEGAILLLKLYTLHFCLLVFTFSLFIAWELLMTGEIC